MSASVVGACSGGAVLTAWALQLGASPLLLGTLWALPYLAQLVQPVAAWLTSTLGAKRVAVSATTAGRQMLWGLALLPLLPSVRVRQEALLACLCIFAVAGVVGNNAWTSWVAVLVPGPVRGRYFGRRTARAALVGTVASLAVGAALDAGAARGLATRALAATSAAGAAFGLVCTLLMARQDPVPASAPLGARALLAPLGDPRARRMLAFQSAWSLSTGVAASFYSAHALGALGLGVTGFAAYTTAFSLVRSAAAPAWGRVVDRVGARPVLVGCAIVSAAASGLWVAAAPGRTWPIAADAILSGVALGGMDLATFVLPMSIAAPTDVPALVAAASMAAGVAFGGASIAGGAILGAVVDVPAATAVRGLFAVSALGRLVAAGFAAGLRLGRLDGHPAAPRDVLGDLPPACSTCNRSSPASSTTCCAPSAPPASTSCALCSERTWRSRRRRG